MSDEQRDRDIEAAHMRAFEDDGNTKPDELYVNGFVAGAEHGREQGRADGLREAMRAASDAAIAHAAWSPASRALCELSWQLSSLAATSAPPRDAAPSLDDMRRTFAHAFEVHVDANGKRADTVDGVAAGDQARGEGGDDA